MDNIIKHPLGTIIMNGGNPLEGCPKDWDEAKLIEEQLNENKDTDVPQWKFDCGYKLDYDGGIISISSRFYPPKTHYGATWDGTVHVNFLGKEIEEKKFDSPTLKELQKEVEAYVQTVIDRIEAAIK